MAELNGESFFQACLQVWFTFEEGLPVDTFSSIIRIVGICISMLSIMFGWTSIFLRLKLKQDPTPKNYISCCRILCFSYDPNTEEKALTLELRNTSDDGSDNTPKAASDNTPGDASDNTPNAASDNTPGDASDNTTTNTSYDTFDNTFYFILFCFSFLFV